MSGPVQRFPSSRSDQSALVVYDRHQRKIAWRQTDEETRATWAEWSPDGKQIATTSVDGRVRIRDAETGAVTATFPQRQRHSRHAAWSPDGNRLALIGDGPTIMVWDVDKVEQQVELEGPGQAVHAVAWSPDSKRVAAATMSGVYLWNVDQPDKPQQLAVGDVVLGLGGRWQMFDLAFDSQGTHLAIGTAVIRANIGQVLQSDGVAQIWNVSGDIPVRSAFLQGHVGAVSEVAWSDDGLRLATSSDDGTIKIWNVDPSAEGVDGGENSERELLTLRGHDGEVLGVSWNSDGTQLISADSTGTVRVWDAYGGYALARDPRLLRRLDRDIAAQANDVGALRLRAEIRLSVGQRDSARDDFLAARAADREAGAGRAAEMMSSTWWLAGPYPNDFARPFPAEQQLDPGLPIPSLDDERRCDGFAVR